MLLPSKRNRLLQETLIDFCDSFKMGETWIPLGCEGMPLPNSNSISYLFCLMKIHFVAWPFNLLCSCQLSVSTCKVPSVFPFRDWDFVHITFPMLSYLAGHTCLRLESCWSWRRFNRCH